MENLAHAAWRGRPQRRSNWRRVALVCCGLSAVAPYAVAASLSPQELQIIGHAAGFLQPPPNGGSIAIVYRSGDAASRRDAEAIAATLVNGLQAGSVRLPAQSMADAAFPANNTVLAIAAAGAASDRLAETLRAAHLLCVTADLAAVKAGFCTMAVITQPRVEIWLNHAAAAAAGIDFAIAFRMMIREM